LLSGPSWTPLVTAAFTGLFMLSFLFKLYWLAAAWALVTFISALRWTWDSGLPRDHPEAGAGAGFKLPLHPAAPDPPGWWGMLIGMFANGKFYLMLLFGYFYLWAVAPGWPPPVLLDVSPLWPWLAAVVLLLATGGAYRALSSNAAGEIKKRNLDLLLIAASGVIACILLTLIPVTGLPAPQTHAYVAVTHAVSGYIALHALLGALISIYVLLRCIAGYVSAQRNLDLRILWLWWLYTLLAGLSGLLSMYGLPLLTGASA
jgi:cytochrome c oxidase subunit I+III